MHTCEAHHCLVPDKRGGLICKHCAPFEKTLEDFIYENGVWGPKWLYEFINGWVPSISINICCNNDGKLLTNSQETTIVSFYIMTYQTKKQGCNFNISAILVKGFTVTEFVPLHDIPYIFLFPNNPPYLSIDEFLASPDQHQDLSTFAPVTSFP